MKYPYTNSDLLHESNIYMYTPFHGESLLQAYAAERIREIRHYASDTSIKSKMDEYLISYGATVIEASFDSISTDCCNVFKNHIAGNTSNSPKLTLNYKKTLQEYIERLTIMTIQQKIYTSELLYGLISALLIKEAYDEQKIWIDKLVQRFEVHKNIYEIYQPGFKKGYGQDSSVRLYWLFGFSLCLYFTKSRSLKYLNTLMKISDILCSLSEDVLLKNIPGSGLSMVLAAELSSVLLIARSKGVEFEIN